MQGSYSKKAVRTAHIISTIGALFGLFGWWLSHKYLFTNIGLTVVGLQSLYFNRDLAAESVSRYNINPMFARGGYILLGLVFILGNIIWLIKGWF